MCVHSHKRWKHHKEVSYLFASCGTVSNLDLIASYDWLLVINDMHRMWNEAVMAKFKVLV